MMNKLLYISVLLFFFIFHPASAQNFTSTDNQVNLIELYTSEGCSSCPPADKWLNKLKHDPRLWSKFIPIAFHVDYWDYLGWKDPFASPQFSERQRQYAIGKNISSIYTPGMLLNGNEWTLWRRQQSGLKLPADVVSGSLSVDLNKSVVDASYQSNRLELSGFVLNIAVLGFDLKVKIAEGENKGLTLAHDFVVLGLHQVDMSLDGDHYSIPSTTLPKLNTTAPKMAVVFWVNSKTNLTSLQATGGWIN